LQIGGWILKLRQFIVFLVAVLLTIGSGPKAMTGGGDGNDSIGVGPNGNDAVENSSRRSSNSDNKSDIHRNIELALGVGGSSIVRPDNSISITGRRPNLGDGDFKKIAEKIFKLKVTLKEKYELADNISFGMYILRYLSELGSYSVPNTDIVELVKSLEKLAGEEFDPDLKKVLAQIDRVRFGIRRGKHYVKFYTLSEDGIRVPINQKMEGRAKEVKFLHIKNKSKIYFTDLVSNKQKRWLKNFITKKVRFLLFAVDALNQIYPPLVKNIKSYISAENPVAPLAMTFHGVYVRVATTTIFKDIDFFVKTIVSLPGITDGQDPLPSVVGYAKGKMLKVKISLDR
jgi:hypothetical protein